MNKLLTYLLTYLHYKKRLVYTDSYRAAFSQPPGPVPLTGLEKLVAGPEKLVTETNMFDLK